MSRLRRGAAAIEFALTATIFFLLLFGIIDYAWYFFRRANIENAVMLGARAGAVVSKNATPSPATVAEAKVVSELRSAFINPDDVAVSASVTGLPPTVVLTVSASMPYASLTHLVELAEPPTIGSTISIHMELQ